jgi:tRNA (mo5U34)-methyltransferase
MIDYQPLLAGLGEFPALTRWIDVLPTQIDQGLSPARWGDIGQWQNVLAQLPDLVPSTLNIQDKVCIGKFSDCTSQQRNELKTLLMELHPWRKGPYQLFGLHIDTEWRSDWKWRRLLPAIEPLRDRLVLDVGCGNGYHCWRMVGEGAHRVIGIDPAPRFVHQFYALKHYADLAPMNTSKDELRIDILPVGIEALPEQMSAFDTVFSMGVLYHRRSPMDHLLALKGLLRPGGQVVLETLIIDNKLSQTLVPEGRYGKMRNVWFLPGAPTLESWLRKCGFSNVACIDICATSTSEQRTTEWMTFESLVNFLDADNPNLTIEGHPAPVRAIFTANTPG